MNLFRKSLSVEPGSKLQTWGHFLLRASAGLMIFYIHGWHKLEGWIAYLHDGTPWKLDAKILSKSESLSTWENKSNYGQRI